jgi:hypothetical protein
MINERRSEDQKIRRSLEDERSSERALEDEPS